MVLFGKKRKSAGFFFFFDHLCVMMALTGFHTRSNRLMKKPPEQARFPSGGDKPLCVDARTLNKKWRLFPCVNLIPKA